MNLNLISSIFQFFGLRLFPFIFLAAAIVLFLRIKSAPTAMFLIGSAVTAIAPYIFLSIPGFNWFPLHNFVMSLATLLQCTGLLFFAINLRK